MRREYYLANREKCIAKAKKWAEKNKEKTREYKRNYQLRKNTKSIDQIMESATWRGRKAEMYALKILKGSKDQNSPIANAPFDLLWKGKKIDVKSNNGFKTYKTIQWCFNKNKGDADHYFCICLKDNLPYKHYLIPKKEFGTGITIGVKSKFDKYLFKVDERTRETFSNQTAYSPKWGTLEWSS